MCWGPTRSKGKDHLRLGTCPGEAGWTCPVPEDYQVHREEVLETDEVLGPVGVLGLGETGKGMNLGEVRVDRTSDNYLVHAVEGGGPVHRHGGLLPWLGALPSPYSGGTRGDGQGDEAGRSQS